MPITYQCLHLGSVTLYVYPPSQQIDTKPGKQDFFPDKLQLRACKFSVFSGSSSNITLIRLKTIAFVQVLFIKSPLNGRPVKITGVTGLLIPLQVSLA